MDQNHQISLRSAFPMPQDTLLLQAVQKKNFRLVQGLLGGNFIIRPMDACQISADAIEKSLWIAATQGQTLISNILQEFGGSMQTERDGWLVHAVEKGDCNEIERLLALGADVNAHEAYALRRAVINNNGLAAVLLCRNGASMGMAIGDRAVIDKLKTGGEAYASMRSFASKKVNEEMSRQGMHHTDLNL